MDAEPGPVGSIARWDRWLVLGQLLGAAGLAWCVAVSTIGAPHHVPLVASAAALGTVSLVLGLLALVQLRHAFRIVPTPARHATLVRSGVYRHLRHPMYTAVLGLVAAVCLYWPAPAVAACGAANFALYLVKARYEESLLRARYSEYDQYRQSTWGVLPGL